MSRAVRILAMCVLLAGPAADGRALVARLGLYMTRDGKLARPLEVRDVQGGAAGFTGKQWTVEPSGEWALARVWNGKREVERRGHLTKEQLTALAGALQSYRLASLASKKQGKARPNPHLV